MRTAKAKETSMEFALENLVGMEVLKGRISFFERQRNNGCSGGKYREAAKRAEPVRM
jgi:hypothetical protein